MKNNFNYIKGYNDDFFDDALGFFVLMKNVKCIGVGSYCYQANKSDETEHIRIEDNKFVVVAESKLDMLNGEYSAFDLMMILKFKNDFWRTIHYIVYDVYNEDVPFVRIGIKYFKTIFKDDRYGISRQELKMWDRSTIVDDYGKDFLKKIPCYDDFTIEPNNKEHRQIIDNNYNLYSPFEHKADDIFKGDEAVKWSLHLVRHIFGEQFNEGLTYFKVLYDHPQQALPILALTSEERSTGKTTCVNWVSLIFGANMVVINPEDIGSQHNSSYADKNIIAIEESRFDSVQATEKLKNLATQNKIMVNPKYVQQYSLPFFGKLIITSNDENKFSRVDNPEIRYWVRIIPTLKGVANHNIIQDLKDEIPQFLALLNSMPDVDLSKSRMVFTPEQIKTDALLTVKEESKPELQKEIEIFLDDHCLKNRDVEFFEFVGKDIKHKFFEKDNKITISYIQKILKNNMKLDKSSKTKRYQPIRDNIVGVENKIPGKPYYYNNPYFGIEIDDSSNQITDDGVPF